MDDILIRIYRVSRKNLRQTLMKNVMGRGFKNDDILIKSSIYRDIYQYIVIRVYIGVWVSKWMIF